MLKFSIESLPLNPAPFLVVFLSLLFVYSNPHLVEIVGMIWLMAVSLRRVPKMAHDYIANKTETSYN